MQKASHRHVADVRPDELLTKSVRGRYLLSCAHAVQRKSYALPHKDFVCAFHSHVDMTGRATSWCL